MKLLRIAVIGAALTFGLPVPGSLSAQAPPSQATSDRLPVRRVVLYKSGVGYFAHLGRVTGDQQVTITFTSGQLDDVLKSLTTLDLDGGRVAGVSYNSDAGLARRLSALRLPLGERATRTDLLESLRGAEVEVRTQTSRLTGRILSVEQQNHRADGTTTSTDILSLVAANGDIQSVAIEPGVSVRMVDAALNAEVAKYLSIVSSEREQDLRQLTISTTGTGERNLFVSYVSEVPVWKTTYRLVLDAGDAPLLQGWAIVDNTIGEDWNDVELSLVAGAPQAFVQHISQPYYVRRPVVPLPERALLAPQTHEGTLAVAEKGGTAGNMSEEVTVSAAAPVVGGIPAPAPPPPPPAVRPPARSLGLSGSAGRGGGSGFSVDQLNAAQAALSAAAAGTDLGDLFEYRLTEPVTILQNQSALVPILSTNVAAEKVSIWNATDGIRPKRAVWITNSTGLTLDEGTVSLVEGQAFSGEGLIEAVKAGEKRFLSYATDLSMRVTGVTDRQPVRTTKVTLNRGVMIQTLEEHLSTTYTARNEDDEPRELVIEHPARESWELDDAVTPVESTAAWHRFRITVAPHATSELTVAERHPLQTRYGINGVSADQIQLFVTDGLLSDSAAQALREVIRRRGMVAQLQAQLTARQTEIDAITADQERVRENLKALKGTAEERQLVQRYVRQLDEQENRLEALREDLARLTRERDVAQAELNRFIESIAG